MYLTKTKATRDIGMRKRKVAGLRTWEAIVLCIRVLTQEMVRPSSSSLYIRSTTQCRVAGYMSTNCGG